MADDAPLAGCRVWLTRPADQAEAWAAAIAAAGAEVTCQPLIAIEEPAAPAAAREALAAAASADIVIATSANAIVGARNLIGHWQPSGRLLAVGRATAAALSDWVGRTVECPQRSDSEGLLAHLAAGDLAGQRVAILAGEGGRALLAEELGAYGACVEAIALYRRRAVRLGRARIAELLAGNTVVVVTSQAAWQALIAACDATAMHRLAGLSLVAPSMRVVQHTDCDIDWRYRPTVVDVMDDKGAQAAVIRAWQARP